MLSDILIAEHIAVVSAPHRRKRRPRKQSQDYGPWWTIALCLMALTALSFIK